MSDDPRSPAAIRAALAQAKAQESYHTEMARSYRLEAEILEERLRLAEGTGLTSDDTVDTIYDVNVDTRGKSEAVKRAAGRATRSHPAQRAFYKANVTIGQIAAELGEGRPRVSSWMATGDALRPIPRRHQRYLERKYGIPETAWKSIKD